MTNTQMSAEQWSAKIAALAVDALLDAQLVPREHFELAVSIVAEEIFVRLCCNDFPPSPDHNQCQENS